MSVCLSYLIDIQLPNKVTSFVRRLKFIMAHRGFTFRGLQDTSGVSASKLCGYAHGKGDPRLDTVRRVAKALGVSVAELIGESKLVMKRRPKG